MLVTAAAKVQIALACLVIEVYIGIDDGIFRVEDRAIIKVLERTGWGIAHGYANLEVLPLIGRILSVVGTEEHIVFAVALIHFGCPEAVYVPLVGLTSLIDASARLPVTEAVANVSLEAVLHRCPVHIVFAVAGMQQEGITELQGQWVVP